MVKKRKFQYFGHYVRGGGKGKAVMEGGMEGRHRRGRLQGNWMRNLREWSGEGGADLRRMVKD